MIMKRAIAYLRFSSLNQLQGDTIRRQKKLVDDWLKEHTDYYLDPVTFEDLGLSEYRGQHAAPGAFSEFMEAVQRGHISSGSVLLVESLDRLSREKIGDATERLRAILKAGIDVVTLSDNTHYTRDSLDDPYSIIKAILIAQRANEESEIKSKRLRASWAEKRKDAAEKSKIMTTKCPYWLKVNNTRTGFEIIEARASVIRMIFSLRLEGMSYARISIYLNEKGMENLKGNVSQWHSASIERLTKKKAVIGFLVPSRQITVTGVDEIPGYYPAIISKDDFERVQLMTCEPESRKDGNFNPYRINIFRSLMRCKQCGHSVILTGISTKGYGYYVCSMRREQRCQSGNIRRDITDRFLIDGLIKGAASMNRHHFEEMSVSDKNARRLELVGKLQKIIRAIEQAPEVTEFYERAKVLSAEIKVLEKEITGIRQERTIKTVIALNEMDISERKECQRLARSLIRVIIMDADAKTCDVYMHNGLKVINYPLTKAVGWSSIIDALAYLEDNEVIL
jgi:DNA invertase Pin-like site-specific DNA recombinase